MVTLRRKRSKYEKYTSPQPGSRILPASGGLEDPFRYSGESLEDYSEMATLSPWTPVPDSVARKIFDIADPSSEDRHVELGSGDGRVNFFAIEAGVQKSIGIDVDEDIIKVANDRLNRIHPKPNLEFIVADLMNPNHPAWNHVEEATILTMYFAKEGLDKIRPLLEASLRGKRCKVFCCGYAMPGWDYQMAETILGMTIYFYDWGNSEVEDSIITDVPMINQFPSDSLTMDKFSNKRKSTFVPDPLRGFHSDDLVDYGWDDFEAPPEKELAEKKN
jgi:SAM-dependent methyltransferase